MEAGGHHQHVGRVLHAVGGDDPVPGHPGDRIGHHVHVVPSQRRVPGVGEQDPLAPDLVVRGHLLPQAPVAHLGGQVGAPEGLDRRQRRAGARQAHHLELPADVLQGAYGPLQPGYPAVERAFEARVGAVHARQHPRRGALVDVQVPDGRGDGGHHLDRRGSGADHRDPPVGQRDGVVPARGVEHGAREVAEPVDLREPGLAQRADPQHHHPGVVLPCAGPDGPAPAGLVVVDRGHLDAEPDPVPHARVVGDAADVVVDLALRGERARPVRVEGEGVRVQVGRDVAGRARIAVVAPGAAHVAAAFEHHQVLDALPGQADGRTQTGEPGPHHQYVDDCRICHEPSPGLPCEREHSHPTRR